MPGLSFFGLFCMALVTLLGLRERARQALRLSWKARWLFLLLGLGYAYSLPGPSLLPGLGDLSPSLPGAEAGLLQMVRLLLLLWLLDGLVISLGNERMMSGLYGIFRCLDRLGFPSERATVRVGLTLRAMEDRVASRRPLRDALSLHDKPGGEGIDVLRLRMAPWRRTDTLMVVAAAIGVIGLWLA